MSKTFFLWFAGSPFTGRSFVTEDKAIEKTREISNDYPDKVYILSELVDELVSGIHSIWYDGKRFTPHSYVEQLERENEELAEANEKMDEYLSHLPVDWQEGDED